MAHQSNITVGGHTVPVWEFDSTAQQIDNVVAALGAASTPQAALANLGAGVRPNLLDNAYFVGGGTGWGVFPINQRGQTSYTSSSGTPVQSIDRWYIRDGAEITLLDTGVNVSLQRGGRFAQVIAQDLVAGEVYTVSLLIGSIGSGEPINVYVQENGGDYLSPINSLISQNGLFSQTFVCPKTESYCIIVTNSSQGTLEFDLTAVKLDSGNTQTLAYQKSDGLWAMLPQNLSYQQELAKCQAYLWVPQQKNGYTVLGVGHAENANIAWVTVVPPVSMRTGGTPTVKISDVSALNLRGSSIVTATGVSVDQATNGTPILLRVEGTFTPGEALDVFLANSASIEFSREL